MSSISEELQNTINERIKTTQAQVASYSGTEPGGTEMAEQLKAQLKPDENLIRQIATARAKLLAAPAEVEARQKPGWVTPQQVWGLQAEAEKGARAEWGTLLGLKEAREGRIEDILGQYAKIIDSNIDKKYKQYQSSLSELGMWLDEKNRMETVTESKRRWETEMALKEKEIGVGVTGLTKAQQKALTEKKVVITEKTTRDEAFQYLDQYASPLKDELGEKGYMDLRLFAENRFPQTIAPPKTTAPTTPTIPGLQGKQVIPGYYMTEEGTLIPQSEYATYKSKKGENLLSGATTPEGSFWSRIFNF